MSVPSLASRKCPVWARLAGRRGWEGYVVLAVLALAAMLDPVPVHAQDADPVPLEVALEDADGDFVVDRFDEWVTTAGRVSTPIMGHDDSWQDYFIQTSRAGVDVVVPVGTPPPAIGDSVIVTGQLWQDAGLEMIIETQVRVVSALPVVPVPHVLSPEDNFEQQEGRLVAAEGTLLATAQEEIGLYVEIYWADQAIISGFVPASRADDFDVSALEAGDHVRVTGVLGQYDEEPPYDGDYQIYLRTPDDIEQLGFSPAFYRRLLLIVVVLLLMAAGWVYALRAQVAARTRKLTESERRLQQQAVALREARDEAEAGTRAKSAFLATVSHEIRAPLNAVIGMSDLLLETDLNEDQLDLSRTVHESGVVLLSLINDILDFSKIEAGHLELEERVFSLHTVIEEAIDLVAIQAGHKGLEVAYLIDRPMPTHLLGDALRVRQVLLNLLSNAVKFTDEGEVVVVASSTPLEGGELEVRFEVRDTGIGIDKTDHDRLFESFSQASSATSRHYGGTGLGLAISKRLCEAMGGTIGVDSVAGEGATFHFTIHVTEATTPADDRELLDTESGATLLVAARNEAMRRMVCHMLERWEVQPSSAASIQEADDLLGEGAYDVVLRVVLLGTRGGDENEVQVEGRVNRPVKREALRRVLARVLSQPREERPDVERDAESQTRERILVVDDNPVIQRLLSLHLQRMGYEVTVALDGDEALEHLRKQFFPVILMDVRMPGMDGRETTLRIRSEWPLDAQPYVIAITADATPQSQAACRSAGMDDFVTKPVDRATLERAMERSPLGVDAPTGAAGSA